MEKMGNSVTFVEDVSSHLRYWIRFISNQFQYLATFKNYWKLFPKIFNDEFPIVLKTKTQELKIKSYNAIYVISQISNFKKIEFDLEQDLIKIPSNNKQLKIFGGLNNGDVIGCFLKKDYEQLPIANKVVIDIGANIGDSSMYFIANGARKVIGIEPFPNNFQLAMKNINENNFEDKIEIIQAVCTDKKNIKIDFKSEKGVESLIKESDEGYNIKSFTLEEIIDEFDVPDESILKIDCEGCEDEIINVASLKTLRQFSDIQIEYHNGYKKIESKLKKCNFDINVTSPIASNVLRKILNKKTKNEIGHIGFIYAKKNKDIKID